MNRQTTQHTHWQIAPHNLERVEGIEDLHHCITHILATRKGTDILRPGFGSNHFDYLDQPYDLAVPNMVREIFIAIQRFEPRIILQSVNVSGIAPHFTFQLHWAVRDEIERQIYTTELSSYGS